MQFKYPEVLYFLFLLIIPVIIHLFQLQKFEKVAFTNVKLLKEIKQQTRKSSTLKKILLLIARLLLFASLIVAFAQPFFNKKNSTLRTEKFIYLDNSFSMQAKGENGEMLQRAKNDLLSQLKVKSNDITIITNDQVYKDDLDKNEILKIDYHPIKKDLKTILLQIENLRDQKTKKAADIILISDFQKSTADFENLQLDSLSDYYFVQKLPVKKENISLDSVWVKEEIDENIIINALIKSYEMDISDLSVSLFMNKELFGKTTVSLDKNKSEIIEFSIPKINQFSAKITLNDNRLKFDNTLFFNIVKKEKISVLAIGENNQFLSKIYTNDRFDFLSEKVESLDYGLLIKQRLIVLNELESYPYSLIQSLKNYQGNLVIIPSLKADLASYNQLFAGLGIGKINKAIESKKYVNKINYNHPFFKNVFEKKTDNYQYPFVEQYFSSDLFLRSSLLKLNDDSEFLCEIDKNDHKIYWFSSSLSQGNSNFINSPLVVPVFYNFGLIDTNEKELYYTVCKKNEIQFKSKNKSDAVFHLKMEGLDFIPLQSRTMDHVKIVTSDKPVKAGIYSIANDSKNYRGISYNYNRNESDLSYYQLDIIKKNNRNVHISNSVNKVIEQINDQNKNRNLWQLFIIFALIFIGIEIFIQKFFKY